MRIAAFDHYLPPTTETLDDLKAVNPDWQIGKILNKTGVVRRHIAGRDETAFDMALAAARKLLARVDPATVEGLVYVTQSPESLIPTTACLLQERLGLPRSCAAFDLNQGCSGFVYGLAVATSMMGGAGLENCLIVCAETYTKYISRHDRTSRPLFSDGASAVLVSRDGPGEIGPFVFHTDGAGAPHLTLTANCGAEDVDGPVLFMDGGKVLRFSAVEVPKAVDVLLAKAGLGLDDIDLFAFHQASEVVLNKLQAVLGLSNGKMLRNYRELGNTVSVTIPILLDEARRDGRLGPGLTVMLVGFGVGYSLAGCLWRT